MENSSVYKTACSKLTLQSEKQGFFNDLVDSLQPYLSLVQFSKCKTDLDRIKFCVQRCWDNIGAELIFRGKKSDEAVQKRLEGNKCFANGELQKALVLYAQSLIQAPPGPDVASVYSNRSALLQKLGEFELAIADIELAISYGAQENTIHKLYERMGSCYTSLKNYKKALIAFKLAQTMCEKHAPEDNKFLNKLQKTMKTTQEKIEEDNVNTDSNTISEPESKSLVGQNTKFSATSTKFDVDYNSCMGRYAYAKEDIEVGEELLEEKPFASSLRPERMGTFCLHCFSRLKAPVPCDTCAHVAFCSKKCRTQAEPYHQYECRIMALLMGSGMSMNCYLAFRIITQSSAEKFKQIYANLKSQPGDLLVFDTQGKYDSTTYENIYNLGALESERSAQDFLERTIMAVFLTKCLRLTGYFNINLFQNPTPTEIELQVASLLLRNLQVVQFNAYEIAEFIMETPSAFKTSKTYSLGLALYPTASYFNHSCAPDVARYFSGTKMTMISIAPVKKGKPIQDNYGPIFIKMTKQERQERLMGRYWFQCSCIACTQDWPMLPALPNELSFSSKEKKIQKQLQKLETATFYKALDLMDAGKPAMASELLVSYLEKCYNLLQKGLDNWQMPYKTIVLAQEGLKLCTACKGSKYIIKPK